MNRWVIHVDMDAFYAAVEQRDNHLLKGKPVIVGGSPESRGVVSTCSYEARQYGVRSAMPSYQAKKLCPNAIFIPPRPAVYKHVAEEIRQIFFQYTPIVEPLSIDEAFLDISGSLKLLGSPEEIGCSIKRQILQQVKLTASVGIANNKFLAKLASDCHKPDGLKIITSSETQKFLADLPVSRMWGIGPKTTHLLAKDGILTVKDLQQMSLTRAELLFGNNARQMLELAMGIDNRPVIVNQPCKSIGHETTFAKDCLDKGLLNQVLLKLAEKISRRLRLHQVKGNTITLKIKYSDFSQITRSAGIGRCGEATNDDLTIYRIGKDLLEKEKLALPVRLIGLTVSNFEQAGAKQLVLFAEEQREKQEKTDRLTKALDRIKDKHGEKIIGRGVFAVRGNYLKK